MESLANLHLELAHQQHPVGEHSRTSEQALVGGDIGSSWDAAGWDEIFDTLNEEEDDEKEIEE